MPKSNSIIKRPKSAANSAAKPKARKPRVRKPKARVIAPTPTLAGTCPAVGIDISKKSFHACLLTQRDSPSVSGEFTADAQGHSKFITWAKRVGQGQALHFCMEETGIYGRALALFLHAAGHHVSLVNAALIKHHGRTLNLRNKNDPVDARLIAHYTLCHVPARWTPPAPEHQRLRELARRRKQIGEMIIAEKNHLEAAQDRGVRAHIEHLLKLLETEHQKVWEEMRQLVKGDATMQRNAQLLQSIPHVAEITTINLLAELPPVDAFEDARQLCAYAGLSPRQEQSGTSVNKRTRMCKQGRSGLRTLLFMPAMSVLSSKSSPLRAFAERLLKAGKAPKCVVGALMRKLLSLAFAILRSGNPFDANYRPHFTRSTT